MESTKLNITLSQLEHLLSDQKRLTAEHVYNQFKAWASDKLKEHPDLSWFLNHGRMSQSPADIQTLKRYIS